MKKELLKSNRNRTVGLGPKRQELKIFQKLGVVSDNTVDELINILDTDNTNDLCTEKYAITNTVDPSESHGVALDSYRQILIQEKEDPHTDKEDETFYSRWATEKYDVSHSMQDISEYFKKIYRFRLSETEPHSGIKWHIDTNTSVMCRGQICLHENDSVFEFKDKSGVHTLNMKPGELWFINTGWNHRVTTHDDRRRTCVFSFLFEDVLNQSVLFNVQ